jgi:hypothetical protein
VAHRTRDYSSIQVPTDDSSSDQEFFSRVAPDVPRYAMINVSRLETKIILNLIQILTVGLGGVATSGRTEMRAVVKIVTVRLLLSRLDDGGPR